MNKITRTDLVDILEQLLEEQVRLELETSDSFNDNFINLTALARKGDALTLTVYNGDTREHETFSITVKKGK